MTIKVSLAEIPTIKEQVQLAARFAGTSVAFGPTGTPYHDWSCDEGYCDDPVVWEGKYPSRDAFMLLAQVLDWVRNNSQDGHPQRLLFAWKTFEDSMDAEGNMDLEAMNRLAVATLNFAAEIERAYPKPRAGESYVGQ